MNERMLPRVESLLDIEDVEHLCRGVMAAAQRTGRLALDLSDADFDEALAHLLGEVYVIAEGYDPERQRRSSPQRQPSFRHYVFGNLTFRIIDWQRWFYGREGQRRPVGHPGGHPGDPPAARLGEALTGDPSDSIDDWAGTRAWVHIRRDREGDRAPRHMGRGSGEEAASGDRSADPVAA